MRYLIAFAVIAAAAEGQSPEIVSYMTTTSMVGKTPVTNTTPIYACK